MPTPALRHPVALILPTVVEVDEGLEGVLKGRPLCQSAWQSKVTETDTEPTVPSFRPARKPGPQLDSQADYTRLELFQLFFSKPVMETLQEYQYQRREAASQRGQILLGPCHGK